MPPRDDTALEDLARQALVCPPGRAPALLRRLGFVEPQRALAGLDRLAGPEEALTPLPPSVLVAMARSRQPDRALRHLERFVEASGGRGVLYRRMEDDPALGEGVVLLLAHSNFLADILVRDPQLLYWLFEETPYLRASQNKAGLRRTLRAESRAPRDATARLERLRRLHRRELLRIGAAEVLGRKDVAQIGRELAELADVVVEAVLEEAQKELYRRYGRPRGQRGEAARFCVVALGKHGGLELNYSSDIDLLFVYDEEGRTAPPKGGEAVDNALFFNRLGERLLQLLTERTGQGFFYRVDMRLRPEGETGPLARSLRSMWIYYESRGQLWERQMLLKARRVAGHAGVWSRFEEMLQPFVFPARFAVPPQEEIRRIKERIEGSILQRPAGDNNIKLQAGGIRDIEFAVQCLQLLRGRVDRRVRSANTLQAVDRLQRVGALQDGEAADLRQAYIFFRRLENLLQIEDGRSVYAVPEDPGARRALAGVMGVADAGALMRTLRGHLKRVRAVFDGLFYTDIEAVDRLDWLLEAVPGAERAVRTLESYGFADGEAAHRRLCAMVSDGSLGSGGRQHFEHVLPELVASLGACPDPDQGLVRFGAMVAAYGAAGVLYEMLRTQANFRRLLIVLCGSSPFLSEELRRDPGLLDGLVYAGRDTALLDEGRRGDLAALGRYCRQEVLRVGADELLGLCAAEETFRRLSEVAREVLEAVFAVVWRRQVRRRGLPRRRSGRPAAMAVLAAGKFGGGELGFGSDLDLFFVYDGEGRTGRGQVDNREFFIETAQEVIRLLHEDRLFEVDARLRPEGRSAPMAIGLPAYRRYLESRGATWERLALTRARPVAGDAVLGRRVLSAIGRFCYGRPVDAEVIAEILRMRTRLEPRPERGKPLAVDVKRGRGGLVDIEFVAQALALAEGDADPDLRQGHTPTLLRRLSAAGHLTAVQGDALLTAYDLFRRLELALRLARDQAASALPGGADLEILARAAGYDGGAQLVERVKAEMERTRHLFTEIFAGFNRSGS